MLRGTLPAGVAIFDRLREASIPLFALTNWASETFAWTRRHHPLLDHFQDIVVSGEEGVAKPDPEIFQRAQQRMQRRLPGLTAEQVVFIDDLPVNVAAARNFGWQAIHHRDGDATALQLGQLGLTF
jgi:2-haloacid dehalogenase